MIKRKMRAPKWAVLMLLLAGALVAVAFSGYGYIVQKAPGTYLGWDSGIGPIKFKVGGPPRLKQASPLLPHYRPCFDAPCDDNYGFNDHGKSGYGHLPVYGYGNYGYEPGYGYHKPKKSYPTVPHYGKPSYGYPYGGGYGYGRPSYGHNNASVDIDVDVNNVIHDGGYGGHNYQNTDVNIDVGVGQHH